MGRREERSAVNKRNSLTGFDAALRTTHHALRTNEERATLRTKTKTSSGNLDHRLLQLLEAWRYRKEKPDKIELNVYDNLIKEDILKKYNITINIILSIRSSNIKEKMM